MVCSLVPAFGSMSPAMSTKVLNNSGCITVRSTAHVPPIDQPRTPQLALLTPKVLATYRGTSLVRWSATLPRGPLTHSVSLLNDPPTSTKTNTGALPPCVAAKLSMVAIALPVRGQSDGVLNSPAIIVTTGSFGAFTANHAGGRYTSSVRCLNCDASSGMVTGTSAPCAGAPLPRIAMTVSRSVSSGSGPRSTRSRRPEPSGSSRPRGSAPPPHGPGTAAPPQAIPSGAASGCCANRAPRRPAQHRSGPPKSRATTARDLPQGPANRCTSGSMPPGSGRRRPPPAATPAANVATANRSPPPAQPRPRPTLSAEATRATRTGRAGIRLAPARPRLTPLSHRHIHQRFCELPG